MATCPPVTQGFCREEGKRGKTRQGERDTQMNIHQNFGTKNTNFVGEIFAIKPQSKSVFKHNLGHRRAPRHVYMYMHLPKTSSVGQIFKLQDIRKQRGRSNSKAEEGRQKKEEDTWKHEKTHGNMKIKHPFRGWFSLPILTSKLGTIEMFHQELPTREVFPIYAVGSITWPPHVNNLATFISCFLLLFFFSKFFSFCRENEILQKNNLQKKVKTSRSITWPHLPQTFGIKCGQVVDLEVAKLSTLQFWPKKLKIYFSKSSKNPIL